MNRCSAQSAEDQREHGIQGRIKAPFDGISNDAYSPKPGQMDVDPGLQEKRTWFQVLHGS
jgi:hypothetical protein